MMHRIGACVTALSLAAFAAAALEFGCAEKSSDKVEYETAQLQLGGFDGVDLLIAVDDSVSMSEEQAILATSFFPLVNALANPIETEFPETDWPYAAADELRLAVVTSNMGLSAGGLEMDEHWPIAMLAGCEGTGDDGVFRDIVAPSAPIQNDVIPCDATAAQCPPDWTCANVGADTGVGTCHTDGSTDVACPGLDTPWAESTDESPNPDFAIQASCLSLQGTDGCELEQPLQSLATALARPDQAEFLHDSHMLAVVVVSDEDDCSIQNAWIEGDETGLFEEPEIADESALKLNIACGSNMDDLFAPGEFYQTFIDAKSPFGVMFTAIVGVPNDGAGTEACQGPGDQLSDCLAQNEMQLTQEQPNMPDDLSWYYHPACTRSVGADEVTRAYPGRRYVELANGSFGKQSYVYSICNADWSPAVAEIARMIEAPFAGECFEKRVAWDSTNKVAACDVVVEYVEQGEVCPDIYGAVEPIIEKETSEAGEEVTFMYCPIPRLPSELECASQTPQQIEAIETEFGWYYCENLTGENACPYVVGFSDTVRSYVAGLTIEVKCEVAETPAQ